ncbi:MAG: RNB domain-containing ribonuclease [Myxococcota bacterium]|nr:RNB domain-containing ribonuclease [Myxococcota bacterium]
MPLAIEGHTVANAEDSVREGQVIEFSEKGKFKLALVMAVEGKRIRVLLEDARESSLAPKQLSMRFDLSLPLSAPRAELASRLAALRAKAEEAAASVSLADLWTLLCDAEETTTPAQAAELLFSSNGASEYLAASYLLRADPLYFRARGVELYEPRSPSAVEELRRSLQAQEERRLALERFGSAIEDAARTGERLDAAHQQSIQLLMDIAVFGDEAESRLEAMPYLQLAEALLGLNSSWPSSARAFYVLHSIGELDRDANLFLRRHRIPEAFTEEQLAQVDTLRSRRDALMKTGELTASRRRVDETEIWTIDDESTQDIDDGVSLELREGGGLRLGIHIAAPAAWLELGSPLDEEARRRATTLYLPEAKLPMFPLELSEDLFSLLPGEERAALSFWLEFDEDFRCLSERLERTWIRSAGRLSYTEVDALLEQPRSSSGFLSALPRLSELCATLARRREDNGAFSLDIPERKLSVSEDGRVDIVALGERSASRRLVAELMVLTNVAAARFCKEQGLAVVYRVQDEAALEKARAASTAIPEGLARSFALRRAIPAASGSLEASPHHGLGVEHYLQASSPIRRYLDLLAHFQLESWLTRREAALDAASISRIASLVEQSASDARWAERETQRFWMLRYLEQHHDEVHDFVVLSYGERGDFAQGVLFVPMLRASVSTRKRVTLGEHIEVVIERVDARADILQLRYVDGAERSEG